MIPADLSARLRLLTEASFFETDPPVAGLARVHAIPSDLPEYAPGQRIQATIQAPLPDGSFRALVNGRQLSIALPYPLAPGTEADLEITQTTPTHIHARIANTPEPPAPRPSLSQAGRLIGALLSGQPPQQPTRLAGGQALVSTPPTTGGDELAPALKAAITQSGLFYESHQARWLAGEVTTGQLRREPQGQLPPPPLPAQTPARTS
ncbi:MAG: flagellar hook-length control protein FliK, partial [Rhodocyclaceae bacterium]|nr:flagellar hook-length control protein FliK [Rhodocyclaceae bacterium]